LNEALHSAHQRLFGNPGLTGLRSRSLEAFAEYRGAAEMRGVEVEDIARVEADWYSSHIGAGTAP
jgi:hypothetical protein